MSAADPGESGDHAVIAIPKRRFHLALAGLLLVMSLSALDSNIVGPALPRIISDLGQVGELSWVLTIFLLTSTAATPVYGKLSDMHGRRPLVTVAVLVFLAGSALCGLAQSMPQLLAGRAFQGLGAGGLMTLTQITMSDLVSPRARGSYQGLFGAVFTLASLAGAPLGGLITEAWSWRWIFYVNVPFGLAALALIWMGLPPGRRSSEHRIDFAGILMVLTISTCLLAALSLGPSLGWGSTFVLGLLAVALALGVTLVPLEKRHPEPLFPPSVISNRIWQVATLVSAAMTMAVFGALAFFPLFLQVVAGLSPAASGLVMTPMAAGLTLSLLLGGRRISRTGRYRRQTLAGVATVTLSLLALGWATSASLGGMAPGLMAALLFFTGAGLGLLMPGLTVALQNAVPPGDIGTATASSGFFRSLAGAFGIAAAGAIVIGQLGLAGHSPGHDPTSLGLGEIAALPDAARQLIMGQYQGAIVIGFLAAAAVALGGLFLALGLEERKLSEFPGKPTDSAA